MSKNLLIFFLLFLFVLPFSTAVTSIARTEIQNSPVKIELITTDLDGNMLTVKAKVSDRNGYEDIEDVGVKVEFEDDIIADYQDAVFDSGDNIAGLYISSFDMSDEEEGTYTVKVRAEDKETSVERKTEFIFAEKGDMITGAFVRVREGTGLLSRLFSWVRGLFS